ncbi:MAG: 30S ribosomal protein S8e [archaeon]
MAILQKRSKRKTSGGRYKGRLPKRVHNLGNLPRNTKIGKKTLRDIRTRGGHRKAFLLNEDVINVYDKKDKKYKKVKIMTVVQSPANRHFVRRNILTKGAIVKTELGDVRITSRPGQEGSINGVLV